jgi:hypothetical protein
MLIGALLAFVPAIFGFVAIERWRRRETQHLKHGEVRSLRSREAWDAVAEYDVRRRAA